MSIESELFRFFEERMNNFKPDNKNMVLYRYGFIDGKCYTLEEIGEKFLDPETINKRERPRQVINDEFRPKIEKTPLKSIFTAENILASQNLLSISEYTKRLHAQKIIDPSKSPNAIGIFSLGRDIGFFKDYNLYNAKLKTVKPDKASNNQNLFLIKKRTVKDIGNGINIAKTYGGLTRFSFLKRKLGDECEYKEEIISLIKLSDEFIYIKDENIDIEYYYSKRNTNTFYKSFQKIRGIMLDQNITEINVTELSKVLHNTVTGTKANQKELDKQPSLYAVEKFIRSYDEVISVRNNFATFSESITPNLGNFERKLKDYLIANPVAENGDIADFLIGEGYSSQGISNRFSYSPIVKVNREKGRRHHTYSLIGNITSSVKSSKPSNVNSTTYEDYKQDLDKKREIGLDGESFVDQYLKFQKERKSILDYEWVSKERFNADHDFKVVELNQSVTFIDVKATTNRLGDRIYISGNELEKISEEGKNYLIYRIFNMSKTTAKLRIIENISEVVDKLFSSIENDSLLQNVFLEGISLHPTILEFGKEIAIKK